MAADQMPVWDVHHHWVNELGYVDRLLGEMDRLGIEKAGLIAMGDVFPDLFVLHPPRTGCVDNEDVARVVREHPDRFWGWGYLRLGECVPDDVDRMAEMGMAGLKLTIPLKPYGEPEYFPVYERAQALGLPCLCHTGILYPPHPMPGAGIRSENYRPFHLEPLAHEFPDLVIIMAHLGVTWNEEAATLCRVCPNFYADLSCRVDGWRGGKSLEDFKKLFYWPTAYRKLLFGSDVHADEIEEVLADQKRILEGIGWDASMLADFLHGNARRLLACD